MSTAYITADLEKYSAPNRMWQGIPGIEVTGGGRIFYCAYSGGITEGAGNFAFLLCSTDGGKTFTEVAVADPGPESRAYDATVWIDPLGRLWFIWAAAKPNRVEFSRLDDPDGDLTAWSGVRQLGFDIMLNKPIVAKNGDWLFPCAVWKDGLLSCGWGNDGNCVGSHVFVSRDRGESFQLLGTALTADRHYDEHMLLQQNDGSLSMFIRTRYGIAKAVSTDGGKTWSDGVDAGLGGPNSRFYIGRLASGRVLLINHYRFAGRNNLTAMLSDDDGETWPYRLLLDERASVSYPDVKQARDGSIYIAYDYQRGAHYDQKTDYTDHARALLFAKITEEDILAGKLVTKDSSLKNIANALGRRSI